MKKIVKKAAILLVQVCIVIVAFTVCSSIWRDNTHSVLLKALLVSNVSLWSILEIIKLPELNKE